jgi:hypothetical protein
MPQLTNVLIQKVSNYPAQLWTSPLMHALYIVACVKVPSDRKEQMLTDSTKFPFPYLWLLWSSNWASKYGIVRDNVPSLCQLMTQAITDPRSNYSPSDAIMSVEHYVASSGLIGEHELRVFFHAVGTSRDLMVVDDDPTLLFLTSLALKLCQQSYLSMFKIFSLLMDRLKQDVRDKRDQELRLFCIVLPLLRDCLLKRSRLRDNTMVAAPDTSLNPAPLPEAAQLNSEIAFAFSGHTLHELEEDVIKNVMIMTFSLVVTSPSLVNEPSLSLRDYITFILAIDVWRGAFEYFDLNRESDSLFYSFLRFTSMLSADSPIRQRIAHWVPRLSKQLNELDSSFGLPEGPYTFEHELRAREMLEAAYAKYFPNASSLSTPAPHAHSNPSPPINGGTQGSGAVGGDAVIEMTVMPSGVANGGDNNPESGEQSQP